MENSVYYMLTTSLFPPFLPSFLFGSFETGSDCAGPLLVFAVQFSLWGRNAEIVRETDAVVSAVPT